MEQEKVFYEVLLAKTIKVIEGQDGNGFHLIGRHMYYKKGDWRPIHEIEFNYNHSGTKKDLLLNFMDDLAKKDKKLKPESLFQLLDITGCNFDVLNIGNEYYRGA